MRDASDTQSRCREVGEGRRESPGITATARRSGPVASLDSVACKKYGYSMREILTVSLAPRTKRLIARAAAKSGLTTSEYVRMAIHRKLWQGAVTESRRVAVPRARATGVFTDEDVFALIS